MTTNAQPGSDETMFCERHPDAETALTCGRCGAPICPRCMVHTPGGIRCPDCAQLRRPPMYELSASDYLRAGAASLVVGLLIGVVGAVILPARPVAGFFGIFIALLGGSGAGSLVAGAMQRVTRSKRGVGMQSVATVALGLGYVERLVLSGGVDLVLRDVMGIFALVIAVGVAWGRLR